MKVAILAGGLGLRLAPETTFIPKPMIEVGGHPILWHIMKHYSTFDFNEFVVALGFRGDVIKRYISEYNLLSGNLTVDFSTGEVKSSEGETLNWCVDLVDTGAEALTGARLRRLAPYLGDDTFMLTYGDGVADVDLDKLVAFHRKHGRCATVTVVRPTARFGRVEFSDSDSDEIACFREKQQMSEGWINGGYFVLNRRALDYIDEGEQVSFEHGALQRLAQEGQLAAFRHDSFWQCMDTARDRDLLEELWARGEAPWKIW